MSLAARRNDGATAALPPRESLTLAMFDEDLVRRWRVMPVGWRGAVLVVGSPNLAAGAALRVLLGVTRIETRHVSEATIAAYTRGRFGR